VARPPAAAPTLIVATQPADQGMVTQPVFGFEGAPLK
jgi:hypothetical protein